MNENKKNCRVPVYEIDQGLVDQRKFLRRMIDQGIESITRTYNQSDSLLLNSHNGTLKYYISSSSIVNLSKFRQLNRSIYIFMPIHIY
jgi:hypothetical protein